MEHERKIRHYTKEMRMTWTLDTDCAGSVEEPSWNNIYDALMRVDGNKCSRVLLSLDKCGGIIVGGGNHDRFIVTYFSCDGNKDSMILTDLSLQGDDIKLVIEGIMGYYPSIYCIDRKMLLYVCEFFYQEKSIPDNIRWEIENTGIKSKCS